MEQVRYPAHYPAIGGDSEAKAFREHNFSIGNRHSAAMSFVYLNPNREADLRDLNLVGLEVAKRMS